MTKMEAAEILAEVNGPTCETCGLPLNGADTRPAPYSGDSGITQADYAHAWGQSH